MRKPSEYLKVENEFEELYLGLFDKEDLFEIVEKHNKVIYGYITVFWPDEGDEEHEGYENIVEFRKSIKKVELTSEYLDDIDDDEYLGILVKRSYIELFDYEIPYALKHFTMFVNPKNNDVLGWYVNY